MGTLGKVLLFINLLAAGGLMYLAAQDWSRRQEIAATVLRHKLVLAGLPLESSASEDPDEIPLKVQLSGEVTEHVSPTFLPSYFSGADGGTTLGGAAKQPSSQLEELKRVQDKIRSVIRTTDPDKITDLCGRFDPLPNGGLVYTPGFLSRMAESFEQRELIRRMAQSSDVAKTAKEAQDMFDRRFAVCLNAPNAKLAEEEATKLAEINAALNAANRTLATAAAQVQASPEDLNAIKQQDDARRAISVQYEKLKVILTDLGTAAARDDADRRRRIVHLMIHLDSNNAWQKRVAMVVGLRAYLPGITEQITRLKAIAESTQNAIVIEQHAFTEEYKFLETVARDQSELLIQQIKVTAEYREQRAKDDEAAKQRYTQLVQRLAMLAEVKKQVADKIAAQTATEETVFAVQQRVGETMRLNFDLETALDQAEAKAAAGGRK